MSAVVLLGGPTASGKSRVALALAGLFPVAVINADSMQVYRELSVLTARPGPAELDAAPHFLYAFRSIAEPCSAGIWSRLARREIAAAGSGGRLALVVGGTGLYLGSLMRGLAPVPEIPAAIRQDLRERLTSLGAAGLHAELARRDPAMAARLHPGDGQRTLRALEVLEHTGRSLLAWQRREGRVGAAAGLRAFALMPPRQRLYAACDARFGRMLEAGALDEARSLLPFDPALPGMKAVGVPQLLAHLRGELTLDQASAAARLATRRYAKRQMTWFRHQLPEAAQIDELVDDEERASAAARRILAEIRPSLLTGSR